MELDRSLLPRAVRLLLEVTQRQKEQLARRVEVDSAAISRCEEDSVLIEMVSRAFLEERAARGWVSQSGEATKNGEDRSTKHFVMEVLSSARSPMSRHEIKHSNAALVDAKPSLISTILTNLKKAGLVENAGTGMWYSIATTQDRTAEEVAVDLGDPEDWVRLESRAWRG